MGTDELHRLHEHTRRAAAGVVDPASVGLEHLDQELDDTAGGIEFTTLLALGARKLRQEVLIHPTEHILGAGRFVAHFDIADEVDELPQALLVQRRAGIVLGQHALECRVIALDRSHGVIHKLADGGLFGLCPKVCPARLGRHPEDIHGTVFVGVFGVSPLSTLSLERRMMLLKGVRNIFEEDQAEDNVFVLGSIHAAAKRVGHFPELSFVADSGTAHLGFLCIAFLPCHEFPSCIQYRTLYCASSE